MRQITTAIRWSLAAMLLATMVLVGCKTTEGVGEDLEDAGDSISDTARDVAR